MVFIQHLYIVFNIYFERYELGLTLQLSYIKYILYLINKSILIH